MQRRHRFATSAALTLAVLCLIVVVPASASAAARHLGAGTATFRLDPTETLEFFAAGMSPCPVAPAGLSFSTTRVTFKMPVYGGTWSGEQGTFLLHGGLAYVRGGASTFTVLDLTGWRAGVNTGAGFSISANAKRSSRFFDENLMGSIPSVVSIHHVKYVKVTNVLLFFNATSAAAIGGVFTTSPVAGDIFGSVTFLARLK